jgi:3-hydroxybutyryl-CoA dehydrogenase
MAVQAIAVIGAGAVGSGIAQVAAAVGLGVTMIEVSDAAVQQGLDRIRDNLQELVAKGKMTGRIQPLPSD